MIYKYLSNKILAKIDEDGISRMSCSVEDAAYLKWLSEGNTPDPADIPPAPTYQELRAAAYPPAHDYLDGIVKGDAAQVQAYINACLAVKALYPKLNT